MSTPAPYRTLRYCVPALLALYCAIAYEPASRGNGLAIAAIVCAVVASVGLLTRRMPPTVACMLVASLDVAWLLGGLPNTAADRAGCVAVAVWWLVLAWRERDMLSERDWLREQQP